MCWLRKRNTQIGMSSHPSRHSYLVLYNPKLLLFKKKKQSVDLTVVILPLGHDSYAVLCSENDIIIQSRWIMGIKGIIPVKEMHQLHVEGGKLSDLRCSSLIIIRAKA